MIIHLLDAHAGRHAVAAAPLLPALLCRMRLRRRPAAPEAYLSASGAVTTARQLAHADAMHAAYAPLADAQQRRPVNGRSLGTLPRLTTPDHPPWHTAAQPVYGEASVARVIAAEEQAKNDAARAWYTSVPPRADMLRVVRDRLREVL